MGTITNTASTMMWFINGEQVNIAKTMMQRVNPKIRTEIIDNTLNMSTNLDESEWEMFKVLMNTYNAPPPKAPAKLKSVVETLGTTGKARDFAWLVMDLLSMDVSYLGRNVFLDRELTTGERRLINNRLAKAEKV